VATLAGDEPINGRCVVSDGLSMADRPVRSTMERLGSGGGTMPARRCPPAAQRAGLGEVPSRGQEIGDTHVQPRRGQLGMDRALSYTT
jgi:hypothetical protein